MSEQMVKILFSDNQPLIIDFIKQSVGEIARAKVTVITPPSSHARDLLVCAAAEHWDLVILFANNTRYESGDRSPESLERDAAELVGDLVGRLKLPVVVLYAYPDLPTLPTRLLEAGAAVVFRTPPQIDEWQKAIKGCLPVLGDTSHSLKDQARENLFRVALGNRETTVNDMIEIAVREARPDITFSFDTAERVDEFIRLATRPETRLAIFMPPGNMARDHGTSCDTPEQEAVRIVKAIKAKNQIPIIVMAVQSAAGDAIVAAGADEFLGLPDQRQQILEAIARCLAREPKRIASR